MSIIHYTTYVSIGYTEVIDLIPLAKS